MNSFPPAPPYMVVNAIRIDLNVSGGQGDGEQRMSSMTTMQHVPNSAADISLILKWEVGQ